jgi:hypothetical protein
LRAEGFLLFSEPLPPPQQQPRTDNRGTSSHHSGRKGRGGGRGRKSEERKAQEKAKLAAFLAVRYGAGGSKLATAAGIADAPDAP